MLVVERGLYVMFINVRELQHASTGRVRLRTGDVLPFLLNCLAIVRLARQIGCLEWQELAMI